MVVGGTLRLDRSHVERGSPQVSQDRPGLVPTVGQDLCARQSGPVPSGKCLAHGGSAGADAQTDWRTLVRHAQAAQLAWLHAQMRDGTYRPQPVRRVWIPKPGSSERRPLGIPAVRDRVVQAALRHVLEPIFETGVCRTELRLPSGTRGQGRAAAGGHCSCKRATLGWWMRT